MPRQQPKAPRPPKRPGNITDEEHLRATGEQEIIAERRVKALSLRKSGASYRQIASHLAVSLHTAWDDVQAELNALRALATNEATELRDLDVHRCDEMLLGLWPSVRRGEAKSVIAAVRVMDRRAKLLGLDAKQQIELSGQVGIDDGERVRQFHAEMERLKPGYAGGRALTAAVVEQSET